MANYLFYSPQLDGVSNPNSVPPMSNSKKPAGSSPGLQPGNGMGHSDLPTLNVPDLNLTPQFGPLLGQQRHPQHQPVHREPHSAHNSHNVNRSRKMEMHDQMSFLSSPMPAGLMGDANMQHLPYFYASPAYNPMAGSSPAYHPMGATYSPLFGVPSPLMFGVGPDGQSFEPLPESAMWKRTAAAAYALPSATTSPKHDPPPPPPPDVQFSATPGSNSALFSRTHDPTVDDGTT